MDDAGEQIPTAFIQFSMDWGMSALGDDPQKRRAIFPALGLSTLNRRKRTAPLMEKRRNHANRLSTLVLRESGILSRVCDAALTNGPNRRKSEWDQAAFGAVRIVGLSGPRRLAERTQWRTGIGREPTGFGRGRLGVAPASGAGAPWSRYARLFFLGGGGRGAFTHTAGIVPPGKTLG